MEEQHGQVYLKFTMNNKPEYFPNLGKSAEHCSCLDASLWQGAVQVPTQPNFNKDPQDCGATSLHKVSPISHLINLQMESEFSKSKYCQKFTSSHCTPEPKAAADDTFPPSMDVCASILLQES